MNFEHFALEPIQTTQRKWLQSRLNNIFVVVVVYSPPPSPRLTFTSTFLDLCENGLNVVKGGQGQHVRTNGVTSYCLQLLQVVVANSDSEHRCSFVL